jgi:hypothetical protein
MFYIQVAFKLENQQIIEREFSPLLSLGSIDGGTKYVVSLDYDKNYKNIQQINAIEFITNLKKYLS